MIVTVGNTKGGVGKTTIALNLALMRAMQGRDVWFVDGDLRIPLLIDHPRQFLVTTISSRN